MTQTNSPPPPRELQDIITYCCRNNRQPITACDVNAHHILLGSTGIISRRHHLLGYLVSTKLNIFYKGNKLTFVISNRQEVIDLTLGTEKIGNLVPNRDISVNSKIHITILREASENPVDHT